MEVIVRCHQQVIVAPPPIGSIVTVKHAGSNSNGRLKQPMFWRERKDLNWETLTLPPTHPTVYQPVLVIHLTFKIFKSVWTKKENHRKFFDWLGKELSIKEVDGWYAVTKDIICSHG